MLWSALSWAQEEFFFFQDSDQSGYYDTGLAFKTAPSVIAQTGPSGDKLPTETTAIQGRNSLRLQWTSRAGGDWSALIIAPGFPFQDISRTDTLSFWAFAPQGLLRVQWPVLFLEGAPGATKSRKYSLADYLPDLLANTWMLQKIPLSLFFEDTNQTNIDFSRVKAVIFGQGSVDDESHTLYLDEVKTYQTSDTGEALAPPSSLRARGYDSHLELSWPLATNADLSGYRIYRSLDQGQSFAPLRLADKTDSLLIDFVRPLGTEVEAAYYLTAVDRGGRESHPSDTVVAATTPFTDEALLDMVQEYTFRYFWDFAHPVSGLIRERNTSGDVVTMGGTGFGMMAILVGIERGFISREQGLERLLHMVSFLETAQRFRGAFPHWMNGASGAVVPFSSLDNGGDIVETAFLIEGMLTVRAYFQGENVQEKALTNKITTIWEEVDWNWYRQQYLNVIYWHWSPQYNFELNHAVRGWNEALMVYLLAIASPTHPVPVSLYEKGWAGATYANERSYYEYPLPLGPAYGGPLFFAHYSFLGFDPRNKSDAYANYFYQNRNHTLINWAYCTANPKQFKGFSDVCWGLTASDDPFGYLAHEPGSDRDNGTITPTAALSSMPYTPNISMAALKHFYRDHGAELWGPMGFYDAFNLEVNWFADSYLAIDQGPIIGMIENHRTELLWQLFMSDPAIQTALNNIGFVADDLSSQTWTEPEDLSFTVFPNPAFESINIAFQLEQAGLLQVSLLDQTGRSFGFLLQKDHLPAGRHHFELPVGQLSHGTYFLLLETIDKASIQTLIKIK